SSYNDETQSLLGRDEQEAAVFVKLLFESPDFHNIDLYDPKLLSSLAALTYSNELRLQKTAALAYSEITEHDVRPVSEDTIQPIVYLMRVPSLEVQRNASAALGHLTRCAENQTIVIQMGVLEPLIRQMLTPNVDAQCNAVGCITNLATADENKEAIANSGALVPLIRLARTPESRVQKNAVGALMNMTHISTTREQLVRSNAVPVLVSLLSAADPDVQYYCATALSNIAVDESHRQLLARTEPALGPELIRLMSADDIRVKSQATLALRNLASHSQYQRDLIRQGILIPLRAQIDSGRGAVELAAIACLRNLSILEENGQVLVDAGFLVPLVGKLETNSYMYWNELASHLVATLRNLASGDQPGHEIVQRAILEQGALDPMKRVLGDPAVDATIKVEICEIVGALASNGNLKEPIIQAGFVGLLVGFAHSGYHHLQLSSASAVARLAADHTDHSVFVEAWSKPHGGIEQYLINYLMDDMLEYRYVALLTVLVFVRGGNPDLKRSIDCNPMLSRLLASVSDEISGARPAKAGGSEPCSLSGNSEGQYQNFPLQRALTSSSEHAASLDDCRISRSSGDMG
ncbi:Vacuolar protein 8, partial [Spiromyces aspiralis]